MGTPIRELIQGIKSLEPISGVTHHLLEVINDQNSTADEIVELIQYESVVTANLMRTCNSLQRFEHEPVNSVKDAVLLLGTEKVAELILIQFGNQILQKSLNGDADHEGVLWKISVSSAVMAKQLAKKNGTVNKHLLFTSSLIKDIGKTILGRFVQGSMDRINNLVDGKNYSFIEAEKKVIGIDHAELGGLIARNWNFSSKMETIIRKHHATNMQVINEEDLAIVYLADKLCMMMGLAGPIDRNDSKLYDHAMTTVGVGQKDLPELIADFSCEMQDVEELMMVV